MKKYLYATTAIVGVGLAATSAQAEEGVKIGLSGHMNTYYGISSRDGENSGDADLDQSHFQDATINFIGSTTLDNGIEVGVRFELESFGHPQDEQFMWFKGSFGEINLGGTNSAGYRMAFAASGNLYTAGIPINTGWVATFIPGPSGQTTSFRRPSLSTFIDTHNDHNTVSYFSPRISGFQFGASWTPEARNLTGDVADNDTSSTGNGQFGPVDENQDYNNALSVGVNYVQSFNGFDVALAGGYNRADAPDAPVSLGGPVAGDEDLEQYMAGINLGYMGFVVGANFAAQDSEDAPGEGANDGESYSFGAGYTTGPWSLAVNTFFSEVEGSAANGEDEQTSVVGGIDYALGPGITVSGSILYTDWEEEGGEDLDAVAGILGTTVTF